MCERLGQAEKGRETPTLSPDAAVGWEVELLPARKGQVTRSVEAPATVKWTLKREGRDVHVERMSQFRASDRWAATVSRREERDRSRTAR